MKLVHAILLCVIPLLLEGCAPPPVRSVHESYSTPASVYYSTPAPVVVTPAPVYVAPRRHHHHHVTPHRVIHRPVVVHRRVVHRKHKRH
ncbi:MAG: hypothetical protein RIS84_361 [Pseudomonadota bacterium]|jgi:hypothetical protein